MLRQSELSSDEIKSIWVSVVGNGVMEIDKEHFRLVMRLIALVQEGYPAESDSLRKYANKPVQFAELKGIQPFVVINRSLNKEAMRAYSELASADVLPGKQAISYLLSLGMEKDELKRIWKFVDYDASLEVNSDQWCILYLLCAVVHNGTAFEDSLLLKALANQPSSFSSSPSPSEETPSSKPTMLTQSSVPIAESHDMGDSLLQFSPVPPAAVAPPAPSAQTSTVPPVAPMPQPSPLQQPMQSPFQQPIQPMQSPLQQPIQSMASPFQQPIQPMQSPLQQPAQPLQPMASLQQPLQPMQSPIQRPLPLMSSPLQQPVQPMSSPLQQPLQPMQSPLQQPLQPMQSPLQQPLQPMQSPFQQPLQSPLQQPIQPIQSPPQQPQQTPQQPQQTPLQQPPQQTPPQQTPTIQDCATHSPPSRLGLKKITLLWTRVATHTLAFVHEGATTVPLKALITQLRQRDVDLDALKAAARALLDENPNLESVSVPQTIRLLVLLNDPSTPTQAPR
ncbi:hypothetical protein WA556_001716, partial [Blastocystis sp. ATCC 50177/Nand II]